MFGILKRETAKREYLKRQARVPELGERHVVCSWVRDGDDSTSLSADPLIDMKRYGELLTLLPDHIVTNLEKARMSRDGRLPLIKAGLGFQEILSSVIVDGTAIASSSTENILFPDIALVPNYMQPGGVPGRTLRWVARGRATTLTTAATLTFSIGSGTTAVTVPTVRWSQSGAITMDTTAQTNSQWECCGDVVCRSVGTAGTVFCQGFTEVAAQAYTIANNHANFMGSAGQDTPATASFDMTLQQYIALTAKWSLTTAYSIQGHIYILESLN